MIKEDLDWCEYFVLGSDFGPVFPGDESFLTRFEKQYGFLPNTVAWMDQVHGTNIEYADLSSDNNLVYPATDGIWTDHSGVMLITKTADCVPLLLWNEHEGIVSALHCGWKGFMAGIIESFASTCEEMSWNIDEFEVFIGPHLRVDHFEVQQDFIGQIPKDKTKYLLEKNNNNYFDLSKGVFEVLTNHGINSINDCGINTYNNPDYFSYRFWSQQDPSSRPDNYSTFANAIYIK